MASSNPPLAQQVYATIASGPSDDDFTGLVDIPLDDEPYPGYSALTSSTGSAISFSSSELNRTVLHRCGASSATYHRMCDEERQALRRFKVERFARDLYERLMKVKRRRDGLETEEEKDARLLAEQCKHSALYISIMERGHSSTDHLSPRNALRRFLSNLSSRISLASSSKGSTRVSLTSSSKRSTVSSRRKSAISLQSTRQPSPSTSSLSPTSPSDALRYRTISLPLEQDPSYRRFKHYSPSSASLSSTRPVFRMTFDNHPSEAEAEPEPVFRTPNYGGPSNPKSEPEIELESVSEEIFHIITNPANASQPPIMISSNKDRSRRRLSVSESQPLRSRTYRRTSTADGQETINEIHEVDASGRRTVRFEWGRGLDEVIPRYQIPNTAPDEGSTSPFPLSTLKKRQLVKRCRDAGEEMRRCGRRLLGKVRGLGRRGNDGTYARCDGVEPGVDECEVAG